jgi:hypothetical protein
MQVVAFCSPLRPDWRWRIVNYAGETVEESHQTFLTIATAVTEGAQRLRQMGDQDLTVRSHRAFGSVSYRRIH